MTTVQIISSDYRVVRRRESRIAAVADMVPADRPMRSFIGAEALMALAGVAHVATHRGVLLNA